MKKITPQDCEKLEESYTAQAVNLANSLNNSDKKVEAQLSVIAGLNDPKIALAYQQKPSKVYNYARAALLSAAVGLAAYTTLTVSEIKDTHQKHINDLQQYVAYEILNSEYQRVTAKNAFNVLQADYGNLVDLYKKKCTEADELWQVGHDFALLLVDQNQKLELRIKQLEQKVRGEK